ISYTDNKWRLNLSAEFFTQANYIYWNQERMPVQLDGSLSGFKIFLQKNFTLWRLHLDNELMYQNFGVDSVVSYPPFVLRCGLYYEDNLFTNAMHVKTGFDINYTNDYYAPGYVGATGQFLVQRETELQNFPVADIFVTVQVHSVRAFVMFQFLNQGFP